MKIKLDPISDMFIRIKNAQRARHESVRIPHSKFKHEILKALFRHGFVGEIERRGKRVRKILQTTLVWRDGAPAVREVKMFSRPGRRLQIPYKKLRRAAHGGIIILSTSKGIMSEKEAYKEKIGGELIAEIW